MTDASNPLLDFSGLPRFDAIRSEHVAPAIDALLTECRQTVERISDDASAIAWETFVAPLEDANERLSRAWGVVGHLHAVKDSPDLRDAYNENLPKVTEYWTELGQNLHLFNKYKALKASKDFASLAPARKRIVDNEIRDFRLGGAELVVREAVTCSGVPRSDLLSLPSCRWCRSDRASRQGGGWRVAGG